MLQKENVDMFAVQNFTDSRTQFYWSLEKLISSYFFIYTNFCQRLSRSSIDADVEVFSLRWAIDYITFWTMRVLWLLVMVAVPRSWQFLSTTSTTMNNLTPAVRFLLKLSCFLSGTTWRKCRWKGALLSQPFTSRSCGPSSFQTRKRSGPPDSS